MSNDPRVHHFVPQFWIKKFAADDGKIWAYDKQDALIKARSPKKIMQLFNLYTIQPNGIDDTSLETIDLNKIDNEGAAAFDLILGGDRSKDAKEKVATFLSAQIMRDHETIVSYNPKAREVTLSLLNAFDAQHYSDFSSQWCALYPGTNVTETEYNYIKSLGLKGAEDALESIIDALDNTDGLPDLPFTDVVRKPDGRNAIRDKLLSFDWSLKSDQNDGFVLGDMGVLFEKGDLSYLKIPLSKSGVLHLMCSSNTASGITSSEAKAHEVKEVNLESAARARRWLIGKQQILEELKAQFHNL